MTNSGLVTGALVAEWRGPLEGGKAGSIPARGATFCKRASGQMRNESEHREGLECVLFCLLPVKGDTG